MADLAVLAVERRARGAFIAAADELRTADELIEEFGMQKAWIPKTARACLRSARPSLKSGAPALAL